MTWIDISNAPSAAIGSRLARLPLVLLLTVGLLLSLIHCPGCELHFALADGAGVTMSHSEDSAPDTPEQQLPRHCGHCLSHVVAQAALAVTLPPDLHASAHAVRQDRPPVAPTLQLFKPPRA